MAADLNEGMMKVSICFLLNWMESRMIMSDEAS